MATELLPFDPAEFLTDGESQTEYLSLAFESGDPHRLSHALSVIARVRGGISKMAAGGGIDSALLANTIDSDRDPGLRNVLKVMTALGINLSAARVA